MFYSDQVSMESRLAKTGSTLGGIRCKFYLYRYDAFGGTDCPVQVKAAFTKVGCEDCADWRACFCVV